MDNTEHLNIDNEHDSSYGMWEEINQETETFSKETNGNVNPPIDPIIKIFASLQFPDNLMQELDACSWDERRSEQYLKVPDLFVYRDIIGIVTAWEKDPNDINVVAFKNILKWFMLIMANNPWWHRRLAYMNRMMGSNINAGSYWPLLWHPDYIPGEQWKNPKYQTPKEFNEHHTGNAELFKWIDEKLDKC